MGYVRSFRYFGSKLNELSFIFPLFPEERGLHLVDVFGGSAVVTLNAPFKWRTYNDLDEGLYCFFKILRDSPEELAEAINLSPHCRQDWQNAWRGNRNGLSELEKARRTYVRFSQSHNGIGRTWGYEVCKNTSVPVNRVKQLKRAAQMLEGVSIDNRPAIELMRAYAHENVFLYLDPPYVRTARRDLSKGFQHEMTDEEHLAMLEVAKGHPGPVMISGMESALYDDELVNWRRVDSKPRVTYAGAKRGNKCPERVEVVWLNYVPPTQQSLFSDGT